MSEADWSQGKKKTEAFLPPVSQSFPYSFRLFAGGETRQNERMWDAQGLYGGWDLWGERASVFCLHLSVDERVCTAKHYFPVLSCRCILTHRYGTSFLWIWVCVPQLDSTIRRKAAFETLLHPHSSVCNSIIPTCSLIRAWAHTSMFTSPLSAVPPWFPARQLCPPHCDGGVLLQQT